MKLLELLLVMSLCFVLTSTFMPGWRLWGWRLQQQACVSQLHRAIAQARFTAIKLQQVVLLCGTSDGMHCDRRWEKGQLIKTSQSQRILQRLPALPSGFVVRWRSSLAQHDAMRWHPLGFLDGQQGSLWVNAERAALSPVRLVLNRAGRVKEVHATVGALFSDFHED